MWQFRLSDWPARDDELNYCSCYDLDQQICRRHRRRLRWPTQSDSAPLLTFPMNTELHR